ncbi:polysaccharide pyruvyl transferase family protein [Sphingomonas sp. Y38-1Y]|uniref:polysaccharide pyruvyl transferase family protein n=1 Tax=Sphingomonas sp. Y38-1Y TaxID=3078265 RepID=UPI0028E625BE|nr:polysaccharide pyruvyl transferase family protein [Sphingomonas sp. Y38-1Y]
MRVGVLTFHRCINYGSYWQARCLVEGLRGLGHDAVLLDHDSHVVRRREWRNALDPQLPDGLPGDRKAFAAKTRAFLDAFEALPQSPRFDLDRPESAGEWDAVVIGSDEVWNFRHPWYGYKPIFFGEGLNTHRRIAYAASFGNHDAAQGIEQAWAAKLARFDHLSVRDDNGAAIVRAGTGREPALVLDPCLAFPPADQAECGGDLIVYGHGFPGWFVEAIRAGARRRGLRIVSLGYRNDWADEQRIDVGPLDFPAAMAGASAVATNFFHGCVFALRYDRPFVTAPSPYRFNKVRDLAAKLSVERQIVTEATEPATLDTLLSEPPGAGERIAALRDRSVAWLEAALG